MKAILEQEYGYLFEADLLKEIENYSQYKKVEQGECIIEIGDTITAIPLLLNGAIKVLREDENNDELLLYFLEKGDTCAMSYSCCLGKNKSEIRAVAETQAELLMIPLTQMHVWMAKYKTWQQYILDSYHTRMMELMETVDTIAFMQMDQRLLKHLQDKAKVSHNDIIYTTHKDIAQDLHTSRVVVSRVLKQLERADKITLGRNQIKILVL